MPANDSHRTTAIAFRLFSGNAIALLSGSLLGTPALSQTTLSQSSIQSTVTDQIGSAVVQ